MAVTASDVIATCAVLSGAGLVGRWTYGLTERRRKRRESDHAVIERDEQREKRVEQALLGTDGDEWGPGRPGLIQQMESNTRATEELADAMARLRTEFREHTSHPPEKAGAR